MITKPMLASAVEGDVRFPVIVSPKLDGIRCLLVGGRALTRNFKPVPNDHMRLWLERALASTLEPNWALDGELTLRDPTAPFQAVSSAVMSAEGTPDLVYRVFDLVTFGGGLSQPFLSRFKVLEHWHARLPRVFGALVEIVPHQLITNLSQLDVVEADHLAAGYEGVMLRDPEGPYKCGRSTAREGFLLKLKRFADGEAVVIGYEELRRNTNEQRRDELGRSKRSSHKAGKVAAGTLGALLVRDTETDVEFSIGSGFSEEGRDDLWRQRRKLKGLLVKYKYQPVGVKEAPRFPVFIGFRDARDL